jgi:hypothetical protein
MGLPWRRAATRGRPYKSNRNIQCMLGTCSLECRHRHSPLNRDRFA